MTVDVGPAMPTAQLYGCPIRSSWQLCLRPQAICNDGSPAGYYHKPALNTGNQTNVWVVYLEVRAVFLTKIRMDHLSRLVRYVQKHGCDCKHLEFTDARIAGFPLLLGLGFLRQPVRRTGFRPACMRRSSQPGSYGPFLPCIARERVP